MRPQEMFEAEEVFFTGTAAEATPVREADGRAIGGGNPGPITLRLPQVFLDAVRGKNLRCQNWLTLASS